MKVSAVGAHIGKLYEAGCRHTVILLGPPGIGKSESTIRKAKEMGLEYRQWQATIEDPLELPGLPALREIKGKDGQVIQTRAFRAAFEDKIPTEGKGILIIDEINSAPPLTQCSLYSLVWDRVLGGTRLGDDWMIVATGNHDKDRAVTQRMPTPLVSRMEHINVEPDPDSWLVMMAIEGGHDIVRAFIKSRPDMFVTFKPEVPGPFACPRTWTMTSKVMNAYGKETPPYESLAGWVGEGPATEFLAYNSMAGKLVDPEVIIKNPTKAPIPDNPGALYAVTTSLASKMTYTTATPIITYLERVKQVEFAVYCLASARDVERGRLARMSAEEKGKYHKIQENATFREWCIKHHELIVLS